MITAESFGVEIPRRCLACASCKECKFKTVSLTARENAEYEIIVSNMKFYHSEKRWCSSYPFIEDPSLLHDSYKQAVAVMVSQEKHLVKNGRVDEFNKVFNDIVERGVFQELTAEELKNWSGLVNYITMVDAFKVTPNATTPLRICMNSAMKQPPQ